LNYNADVLFDLTGAGWPRLCKQCFQLTMARERKIAGA
jgi:hypothetical protein